MATRKYYLDKPSFLYLGGSSNNSITSYDPLFDVEESDFWNSKEVAVPSDNQPKKYCTNNSNNIISCPPRKPARKSHNMIDHQKQFPSISLPVDVPDWSKILREEYKSNRRREMEQDIEDYEDEDEDDMIPPHEYLARFRIASFSVREGNGRTLKGRDLSRVRNAVWKQTGFED